jgi:hypothetical protein
MEIRELRPEEVPPDSGVLPGSLVMGVLDGERVVAVLAAFTTVFLDPLWVAPTHRGRSTKFLWSLWTRMKSRLREADIRAVIGHADQSQPAMGEILQRLGKEVPRKRQFVLFLGE